MYVHGRAPYYLCPKCGGNHFHSFGITILFMVPLRQVTPPRDEAVGWFAPTRRSVEEDHTKHVSLTDSAKQKET